MKKSILIFLLVFSLIFASSCDAYGGQRPYDYPNSRWVCEELDLYFEYVGDTRLGIGEWKFDDRTIEIEVYFNFGVTIDLCDTSLREEDSYYTDIVILRGMCKFGSKKLVVNVETDWSNNILDESVKKLVFVREDITPDYKYSIKNS